MTERNTQSRPPETNSSSVISPEEECPTREQLLVADITDLVQFSVPDRFPAEEDRVMLDKTHDEFSVHFRDDRGMDLEISRFGYPRGEKNDDGVYTPESVIDEYFVVVIDGGLPHFINNEKSLYEGTEFSDKEFDKVTLSIKAAFKSVEDGQITSIINKRDLKRDENGIGSPTLGQMIPVEKVV